MQQTIEDTPKTVTAAPEEADLRELGFTAAADGLKADRALAKKLRIAFEHFRVVELNHIYRFNEDLKARTVQDESENAYGMITTYDRLKEVEIGEYRELPPKDVLDKVRHAKSLGCFDSFEVATIQSVREIPDPIIFGRINGTSNRYFVAQWDDDVNIDEILHEGEG